MTGAIKEKERIPFIFAQSSEYKGWLLETNFILNHSVLPIDKKLENLVMWYFVLEIVMNNNNEICAITAKFKKKIWDFYTAK